MGYIIFTVIVALYVAGFIKGLKDLARRKTKL